MEEHVVFGFQTLLRGSTERWYIHSDIDKTNLKKMTNAFKTPFLNPRKCSTVTLFQQKQRVSESVQDLNTSMRAINARLDTPEASSTCRASARKHFIYLQHKFWRVIASARSVEFASNHKTKVRKKL